MTTDKQFVVLLQHSPDDSTWTTLAHGVPLDERHLLLRATSATSPSAGGRLRLLPAGEPAGVPAPVALDQVATLPRAGRGRSDLVMVTLDSGYPPAAGAAHGTEAAAVRQVLDLLADDTHPLWARVPRVATPVSVGASRAPGGSLAPARAGDGGDPPETPLSWTCRLFGIGCPDPQQ